MSRKYRKASKIIAEVKREPLGVEVTSDCNISCPHCFAKGGRLRSKDIGVGTVKDIVEEGYSLGYRRLHLTGGEPLLWPWLFGVLDYSLETGYNSLFLNTNGILLSEKVAEKLTKYENLQISISLECCEKVHNSYRGNGVYRKVLKGLGRAIEAGIDVTVFSIAGKAMLDQLPAYVDWLYNKYPDLQCLTFIQLFNVNSSTFTFRNELLTPYEYLQLIRTIALLNLKGYKCDLLRDPLSNVASTIMDMPWIPKAKPLYTNGSLFILSNKNIGVCHSSKSFFGKYESGILKSVLNSNNYRKIVEENKTVCSGCKYIQHCRANGMIRPSIHEFDTESQEYCKRVLDTVNN